MIWKLNEIRMGVPYGYWLVYDAVTFAALLLGFPALRWIALGFLGVAVFFDIVELVVKWKMTHGEFRVRKDSQGLSLLARIWGRYWRWQLSHMHFRANGHDFRFFPIVDMYFRVRCRNCGEGIAIRPIAVATYREARAEAVKRAGVLLGPCPRV